MSDDMAAFLLARIAEDKQLALDAAPGPWVYQDVDSVGGGRVCDPTVNIASLRYEQPGNVDPCIRRTVLPSEADGTGGHIVRHDPARVLGECEAKQRIVELHHSVNDGDCVICIVPGWGYPTHGGSRPARLPCTTLRLLALPYVDHPDFREGWKL